MTGAYVHRTAATGAVMPAVLRPRNYKETYASWAWPNGFNGPRYSSASETVPIYDGTGGRKSATFTCATTTWRSQTPFEASTTLKQTSPHSSPRGNLCTVNQVCAKPS